MSSRGAEYAVAFALEFIKALYIFEQMGKEPSLTDLANFLKTNFHTITRYRRILENEKLIVIEPRDRKNVVRLTERGRCIARCLVG